MDPPQEFIKLEAYNFLYPVIETGKHTENCSHRKYIVEVSDYIISIVEGYIKSRVGEYHPC
jgi:hypothetical protein